MDRKPALACSPPLQALSGASPGRLYNWIRTCGASPIIENKARLKIWCPSPQIIVALLVQLVQPWVAAPVQNPRCTFSWLLEIKQTVLVINVQVGRERGTWIHSMPAAAEALQSRSIHSGLCRAGLQHHGKFCWAAAGTTTHRRHRHCLGNAAAPPFCLHLCIICCPITMKQALICIDMQVGRERDVVNFDGRPLCCC